MEVNNGVLGKYTVDNGSFSNSGTINTVVVKNGRFVNSGTVKHLYLENGSFTNSGIVKKLYINEGQRYVNSGMIANVITTPRGSRAIPSEENEAHNSRTPASLPSSSVHQTNAIQQLQNVANISGFSNLINIESIYGDFTITFNNCGDRIERSSRRTRNRVVPYTPSDAAKSNGVSCPICLESVKDREPVTTMCGHIYCKNCITASIESHDVKKCPMCKTVLPLQSPFHRVYL